jgi:hypothetical protein
MSRGSQIVIGIILFLLSAVCLLTAAIPGEEEFLAPRLMAALLFGALGFATVFTWGRPLTTRVALGVLSLGLFGIAIYTLFSENPELGTVGFAVVTGLMSGTYAATGYYPQSLPMAEVFGKGNTGALHREKPKPN